MASSYVFYLFIFLLCSYLSYNSAQQQHSRCPSFICGSHDTQIRFPFINTTIKPACGSFILNCSSYPLPRIQLNKQGRWYPVEVIDYFQKVLVIQDPLLQNQLQSNLCDPLSNFTDETINNPSFNFYPRSTSFSFFKCKRQQLNDSRQKSFFQLLHNYTGCVDDYDLFFTGDYRTKLPNLPGSLSNSCSTVQLPVPLWWNSSNPVSWLNPVRVAPGWNLSEPIRNLTSVWGSRYYFSWEIFLACFECLNNTGGFCLQNPDGGFLCGSSSGNNDSAEARGGRRRKTIIGVSLSLSVIMLIMIISYYYYSRKRYLTANSLIFWKRNKNDGLFKDFLEYHKSLTPQRYSYSDIKKMTNSFKYKLGQGGYGGVFKGKLPDGRFVAVKELKESKGNGEDFINEVASISKTSHVNIVRLVGFCSEGPERALVYDFMPNGSLDKYIYNKSSNTTSCQALSLEMLYQIAIGIAQGLEDLHRDCSTRIVHFDIKPHNILLDENFSPKISDFGLAKLSARKDSAMSMLGARGTVGYIAPEVVYAHYGGVSYKSDVYSYGMMVLEMVGRRHNLDAGADRTSEIYFPDWICQHLEQEEYLRLHGIESESEREIAKKMIFVGLWCIQTNPLDRPSMTKVLEMLEGSLESIELPPQPCLYSPPQRSPEDSHMD